MSFISKKVDTKIIQNTILTNIVYEISFEWYSDSREYYYFENVNENLVFNLSKKHECQFKSADGNELVDSNKPAKMKSLFSSSALAVNVFSYIEHKNTPLSLYNDKFSLVDFEKKLITLKSKKGKPVNANIDVYLKGENTIIFVESKFSELYYKKTKNNISKSYLFENDFYDYDFYNVNLWKDFINDLIIKYPETRFDIQQSIKHLIGIYNFLKSNPEYLNYDIVLLNAVFNIDAYDDSAAMIKQNNVVNEFNIIQKVFIDFAKEKLMIVNFKYELMFYEDLIKNHIYDDFIKEYLLRRYFNKNSLKQENKVYSTYYKLLSKEINESSKMNNWDVYKIIDELDKRYDDEVENSDLGEVTILNDIIDVFYNLLLVKLKNSLDVKEVYLYSLMKRSPICSKLIPPI